MLHDVFGCGAALSAGPGTRYDRNLMPGSKRRNVRATGLLATVLALLALSPSVAADPYLADFKYPYSTHRYDFQSQGQDLLHP